MRRLVLPLTAMAALLVAGSASAGKGKTQEPGEGYMPHQIPKVGKDFYVGRSVLC